MGRGSPSLGLAREGVTIVEAREEGKAIIRACEGRGSLSSGLTGEGKLVRFLGD